MIEQPRKAAVTFIFITVVLDVLSLSIIIPVLPILIQDGFLQGNSTSAAHWVGVFGTVWALMQFICSPIMGALSDQFGRRRILLLSCMGLGLDYILMALSPNLYWLFAGRILSGIFAASFATAAAYIADVTPPEKRAASYGMFGAAWGLGFVLGPVVGGTLALYDQRLPFWVAAALTLLNAAYGYFILPESLPQQNRRKFSWTRANPLGSLRLLRSHPDLLGLASIMFLYQLAHQVLSSIFVLYAKNRYSWDEQSVGCSLAAVGIAGVIVQGGLVRPVAGKMNERKMLFIGLLFGATGYFIYGTAQTGYWFLTAIPVFAFVGFFSPAIQGLMTRRVQVNEQGQLQGANSSMMGIAGMTGPLLFTFLYTPEFQGAPFIVAGCLHILAIIVAWCIVPNSSPKFENSAPASESVATG